jgi:hypothetical protein
MVLDHACDKTDEKKKKKRALYVCGGSLGRSLAQGGGVRIYAYVGNRWKWCEKRVVALRRGRPQSIDESRIIKSPQGWGEGERDELGLVGAMVIMNRLSVRVGGRRPVIALRFDSAIAFRNHAGYGYSTTKAPVVFHRGVAGSTEDGRCYAHPNTFRAEHDGRFNWSSYHTCRVACRRAWRNCLRFFTPPYLITRMIKIIYIGEGGRETFRPGETTGRTHAKRRHST